MSAIITDFFRVVNKGGEPAVARAAGSSQVLNVNCAPAYTPEGQETKWTRLELWGTLAEKLSGAMNHNDTFFIIGEEKVTKYNDALQFTIRVSTIKRVKLLSLYEKTVDTEAVDEAKEAINEADVPF